MAKNIVIFSDGTGQAGGMRPDQRLSNVYKIYRAARVDPFNEIDPAEQVCFYDPGLGTDDDVRSGFTGLRRSLNKLLSSATGRGITHNIIDCYEAILNLYEPGDRIFLFGFSRGAYTARCVTNLISLCGIPTTDGKGNPLPRYTGETRAIAHEAVVKVYEYGAGRNVKKHFKAKHELGRRFRLTYSSGDDNGANVYPYFVGVFDTVASLGSKGAVRWLISGFLIALALLAISGVSYLASWLLPLSFWTAFAITGGIFLAHTLWRTFQASFKRITNFPEEGQSQWHFAKWRMKNYDRGLSTRVGYTRHAISIDETRADFPRVKWGYKQLDYTRDENIEPFVQLWFAGNHSDIGGSYPETESRLSDIALRWMVDEACSLPEPLKIDERRLNVYPSPNGMQHCEVESLRNAYPRWWPRKWRKSWKEKLRTYVWGAPVHDSVKERFAAPAILKCGKMQPYRPESLRKDERFKHYYDPE
ncbi:MAG: DUF2235 domain-containing protein [Parasphingorhabdus sp.]